MPDAWAMPGAFPSLQFLQLTTFDGSLPDSWASNDSFPMLNYLSIESMALTGTLPSSWGQNGAFSALQSLYLTNTSLAGNLPTSWASEGSFVGLTYLDLRYNHITGVHALRRPCGAHHRLLSETQCSLMQALSVTPSCVLQSSPVACSIQLTCCL